jgi:hypothetical protein
VSAAPEITPQLRAAMAAEALELVKRAREMLAAAGVRSAARALVRVTPRLAYAARETRRRARRSDLPAPAQGAIPFPQE